MTAPSSSENKAAKAESFSQEETETTEEEDLL
jgi:hypothetical protein